MRPTRHVQKDIYVLEGFVGKSWEVRVPRTFSVPKD